MKTIVKHVGSVREWEGPEENSKKHRDVIEHWVDGGDVEYLGCNQYGTVPTFETILVYRIKQREPKPGEVWTHPDDGPCMYFIDTIRFRSYMIELGGQTQIEDLNCVDGWEGFVYSSPSVEAYYARKFMDCSNVLISVKIHKTYSNVSNAAQLDANND